MIQDHTACPWLKSILISRSPKYCSPMQGSHTHRARDNIKSFSTHAFRGLWVHVISHSESSGNHAVKIYAQCMNYRISAKILNSLSSWKSVSGPGELARRPPRIMRWSAIGKIERSKIRILFLRACAWNNEIFVPALRHLGSKFSIGSYLSTR